MLPYYTRTPTERPAPRSGHGFAVFVLLLAWLTLVGVLIGGPRAPAVPPVDTVSHCLAPGGGAFQPRTTYVLYGAT